METQHQLEQAPRLHPHSRYFIAFLLGLPVGFLFRPFYTSNASLISSVPSTPPLLTLWNLWQIPVLLLWGLMLFRAIRSFKTQKDIRTPGRFILTGITLLLALPALLYGIAPLDQLQWMHLYLNLTGLWYPCFNPFAVGLAVAFILHKNDQRTSSFGKGPLLAVVLQKHEEEYKGRSFAVLQLRLDGHSEQFCDKHCQAQAVSFIHPLHLPFSDHVHRFISL